MRTGIQKYFKMNNYLILPTLILFLVLSISCFHLTSAVSCWSENKDNHAVSSKSPQIDLGNFMVYQKLQRSLDSYRTRDVFIYWKEIHEEKYCWYNFFAYFVTCTLSTNDEKIVKNIKILVPVRSSRGSNFVKLEELHTSIEYICKIYVVNTAGLSKTYSAIIIPRESDRNPKLLALTIMQLEKEGQFELSWNDPSQELSSENLSYDYTIYWCEKNINIPLEDVISEYGCTGPLNWNHIPGYTNLYNITIEDKNVNYVFAISLNSLIFNSKSNQLVSNSTGMIWQSCTMQSNKLAGKINNIVIDVISSEAIQLHWTFYCSKRIGTIQGYHILYCEVNNVVNAHCVGPIMEKNITLEHKYGDHTIILKHGEVTVFSMTGFKPMNFYMLTISVITEIGEGLPSDPVYINTKKEGEYNFFGSEESVLIWDFFPGIEHSIL